MNRFDSLKLWIHGSCLKVKPEFVGALNPVLVNGYSTNRQILEKGFPPGLNLIEIVFESHVPVRFIISVSAKILNERYPELITAENFSSVLSVLSLYLHFDPSEFLEFCEVLSCHVTANVPIKNSISTYLLPLACLAPPDFRMFHYKNVEVKFEDLAQGELKDLETVSFRKAAMNGKDRIWMTFYDKAAEMRRKRKGRFYRKVENFEKMHEFFKGHLRVELQLASFSRIRKAFKLRPGNIRLLDLLNSKEKPLYEYFRRIRGNVFSATEHYDPDISFSRLQKLKAMDAIISDFGFDMPLIKNFLKERIKGNPKIVFENYRKRIEELKNGKLHLEFEKSVGHLAEVENYLREN